MGLKQHKFIFEPLMLLMVLYMLPQAHFPIAVLECELTLQKSNSLESLVLIQCSLM